MDNKQLFTRFEYLPTSAVLKNNTKCVDVVLVYKQHVVTKSLYIPNKSGMKSSDFVDEAKKLINKQLNSGELEAYAEAQIKKEKKKKKGLIVCFSCLGVLALAGGAGVATYYFLRHKGPEVKVSIPKIDGLKFTNTRAYAGEDFDTKITIDTSKTDGKVLPDKLTRVSSGNREVKPTEYTYSITDEAKENAKLHIPGQYVEADITISLELVNPTPDTNDYLTFTSLTDNSKINIMYQYYIEEEEDSKYGYHAPNLEFSKDNGKTWTDITSKLPSTDGESVTILDNIKRGDKVMFRGDNNTEKGFNYVVDCDKGDDDVEWNTFSFISGTNDEFSVSGNIMSLIKKTDFDTLTTLPADGCFAELFKGSSIVDASELKLPAETLTHACYEWMFYNSTKLTKAPKLPSTNLAKNCYSDMFKKTAITEAPALNATVLAEGCYQYMFLDCEQLVTPPTIKATTLAEDCFALMFKGCSSLTSTMKLPELEYPKGSCDQTYCECTALTTIYPIKYSNASFDSFYYFSGMFADCDLNITTSAEEKDNSIFYVGNFDNLLFCDEMFDSDVTMTKNTYYNFSAEEPIVSEYTEIKYHYSGEEPETDDHKVGFTFTTTDNDVTVDWGDGTPVAVTSPAISTLGDDDATIKVYGDANEINFTYDYIEGNQYITSIVYSKYVTTIPDGSFTYAMSLTNVTFSEGTGKIGSMAFVAPILETISIPSTVTEIGKNPFYACKSLNTITVASNNTTYSSEGSNLIDISNKTLMMGTNNSSIPSGVEKIEEDAFYMLKNMKDIVIPNTVTSIGVGAFCEAHINSLAFEEGTRLETISNDMLKETVIVEPFSLPEGIRTIIGWSLSDSEIKYTDEKLILPSTLEYLGESAFCRAAGFNTLVLNAGLKEIGTGLEPNPHPGSCFDGTDVTTVDATALTATSYPTLLGDDNFPTENEDFEIIVASEEVKNALVNSPDSGWAQYENCIKY